jgi:hypothetical protein
LIERPFILYLLGHFLLVLESIQFISPEVFTSLAFCAKLCGPKEGLNMVLILAILLAVIGIWIGGKGHHQENYKLILIGVLMCATAVAIGTILWPLSRL